jgi:hypothetical protein
MIDVVIVTEPYSATLFVTKLLTPSHCKAKGLKAIRKDCPKNP